MWIGFVIWSIGAFLFLGIGASSWKSKEAVGFFTFVKAPVVSDIKKYNHSVAVLWMVTAVIFEILGVPLLFAEQNSPIFILMVFGVVALFLVMMILYIRIEMKYKK
jgi:hypothetical protein